MTNILRKIIPGFLIDKYHFFWAGLGAFIYGFPSRQLKIIGITGTNGKSTTINLIAGILEEAGFKVAALSSIKFKIGKKEWPNKLRMTMPGRLTIQKFLRDSVSAGCQYAVLEVTSEGIKQHRHQFIDFDCAVFTNLSPEHIEAHGSFEKYRDAKGRFFKKAKGVHIVNLDDENADYFLQFPADKKYGYNIAKNYRGLTHVKFKVFTAENVEVLPFGVKFSVENTDFNLNLLGGFNVYNTLAAICVGVSEGIDLKTCAGALTQAKGVPGRMEIVIRQPFTVFVDYAFTPNALSQVYKTIRDGWAKQKMICVLGACGGGRDKWKRPVLGKLAAQHCDKVIVTNEDPYDENPLKIMEDIESGFSQIPSTKSQISKYQKILDRRKAIRRALEAARPGDVVVITGKGSEPSICMAKGKKIPWDDHKVVKEEFKKITRHQ